MTITETTTHLQRKIDGAKDLKNVVRTMKALAASNIVQYEDAVNSLSEYSRTIELALAVCFRTMGGTTVPEKNRQAYAPNRVGVIVIGSDQGLVGQFNDVLVDFTKARLTDITDEKSIWAVGERMCSHLLDTGISVSGVFETPNSVAAITPLIGELLLETESLHLNQENPLYLFHNRSQARQGEANTPVCVRLLPLDSNWRLNYAKISWPTENLPEIVGNSDLTLRALIREYLFVSLFQACAESLAGENASRLAAMQRAEKNINEMLNDLNLSYHQMRQRTIDEELFDVISGYESGPK